MELREIESSNIAAAGYDAAGQVLRVRFNSGAEYDYLKVSGDVAKALFEADSVGKYFFSCIKTVYECQKVEVDDGTLDSQGE